MSVASSVPSSRRGRSWLAPSCRRNVGYNPRNPDLNGSGGRRILVCGCMIDSAPSPYRTPSVEASNALRGQVEYPAQTSPTRIVGVSVGCSGADRCRDVSALKRSCLPHHRQRLPCVASVVTTCLPSPARTLLRPVRGADGPSDRGSGSHPVGYTDLPCGRDGPSASSGWQATPSAGDHSSIKKAGFFKPSRSKSSEFAFLILSFSPRNLWDSNHKCHSGERLPGRLRYETSLSPHQITKDSQTAAFQGPPFQV